MIVPGNAKASELIARINSDDDDLRMPPPDFRKTLSAEQKAAVAKASYDLATEAQVAGKYDYAKQVASAGLAIALKADLDRSITRPLTYGPLSLTLTTTLFPFFTFVTLSIEPNGNFLCAAVFFALSYGSPLAVFLP